MSELSSPRAAEPPQAPALRNVDPLTLSTVWHSLQRICREMRRVIERTTQSYLISQLKDISVGIWDGQGNTVAIPVGLPAQFVGAKYSVRYLLQEYGDDIHRRRRVPRQRSLQRLLLPCAGLGLLPSDISRRAPGILDARARPCGGYRCGVSRGRISPIRTTSIRRGCSFPASR